MIKIYIIPKGGDSYIDRYMNKDKYRNNDPNPWLTGTKKGNLYYAENLLADFITLYGKDTPEPTSEPQEQCLDGRRSLNCIKLSDYYRYLNYLSTTNELLALKDEYVRATGDDIKFVDKSDSIKIEKIKESGYKPTNKKNPEFFDWADKNKLAPITEPTTIPIAPTAPTTPENILQKYYDY